MIHFSDAQSFWKLSNWNGFNEILQTRFREIRPPMRYCQDITVLIILVGERCHLVWCRGESRGGFHHQSGSDAYWLAGILCGHHDCGNRLPGYITCHRDIPQAKRPWPHSRNNNAQPLGASLIDVWLKSVESLRIQKNIQRTPLFHDLTLNNG